MYTANSKVFPNFFLNLVTYMVNSLNKLISMSFFNPIEGGVGLIQFKQFQREEPEFVMVCFAYYLQQFYG